MQPEMMRAIEIAEPGGPEVLRLVNRPTPAPGDGQVLLQVTAAGVNRPDAIQRQGHYDPPRGVTDIPGLEVAGRIISHGPGVPAERAGLRIDDRVCALVPGGGYAEYCVADAALCLPIPLGLTPVQAAAVPETFFTVWSTLFDSAGLKAGEILLLHGGSSGIGTTAIQLAKAFGAQVYVTAGSDEKCAACEKIGADMAINYRTQDFVEVIERVTLGAGVDVILDMVGGDYVPRNLKVLATGGRHVSIGVQRGIKAEVNLFRLMARRQTMTGSTLRARPLDQKAAIAEALRRKVWPLLEAGTVAPVIDRVYPLDNAAEAHRLMESSAHIGKIVLALGAS